VASSSILNSTINSTIYQITATAGSAAPGTDTFDYNRVINLDVRLT
jgi:hypothetical protein